MSGLYFTDCVVPKSLEEGGITVHYPHNVHNSNHMVKMVSVWPESKLLIKDIRFIRLSFNQVWLIACETIQMLRDTMPKVSVKDAAKDASHW